MAERFFHRFFKRAPAPPPESMESQAIRGSADAQFHLGFLHANGRCPTPDYASAAEWYRKAAEQNHPLAQVNLGTMYAQGQGMQQDEREAEVWFAKAAHQGDAGAQHRLGMSRYRQSIRDLPETRCESRIEACKWFILAAAQGYHGSEAARARVSLKMTRKDVTEAAQRVDRFMLRAQEGSNSR